MPAHTLAYYAALALCLRQSCQDTALVVLQRSSDADLLEIGRTLLADCQDPPHYVLGGKHNLAIRAVRRAFELALASR